MPDYFIKNEASMSFTNKNLGNYTGVGMRFSKPSGSYEGMVAFKSNDTSTGGFGEFKYTTPKHNNLAFESRTRIQLESAGNSMTMRMAGKYSKNLGKDFNIYEITGVSAKLPFESKKAQSVTPVSLTGIGYNINSNLSCYAEGEISKSYNINSKDWGKTSTNAYLGIKYTF